MQNRIKLIIGGDVMLGGMIKNAIHQFGPKYPLEEIAYILQKGDVTLINLECVITDFNQKCSLIAIQSLIDAGVNVVSLANNHILDFSETGLFNTVDILNKIHLYHAGAGKNEHEAYSPAVFTKKNIKFGLAAFCNDQQAFAAHRNQPGMAYISLHNLREAIQCIQTAYHALEAAKVDFPILSINWQSNMIERPTVQFIKIAHAAIEMGYKLLFGHGSHFFQGIEIYHGCPIIYEAGDLVDDSAINANFRNDHQLLFELDIVDKQIYNIIFYPVFIDHYKVMPATGDHFDYIAQRIQYLCNNLNTTVYSIDKKLLLVELLISGEHHP